MKTVMQPLEMVSLAIGASCAASITHAVEPNLITYYQFSGSAIDAGTAGNNASVVSATLTDDRNGAANSAYHFNGIDARIERAAPFDLDIGPQSWSVAAWIQATPSPKPQAIVSRYECGWNCGAAGGAAYAAYYLLALDSSGLPNILFRGDSGLSTVPCSYAAFGGAPPDGTCAHGSQPLTDGSWHHLAGVLNQTTHTVSLYVDGSLVDSESTGTMISTINDSGSPLSIGRVFIQAFSSSTFYFSGNIDEVRIYNRALTQTDVQHIMTVPEPSIWALFGIGLGLIASSAKPTPRKRDRRRHPSAVS